MKLRYAFPLTVATGLYVGHIFSAGATLPTELPEPTYSQVWEDDTVPKGHTIDFWEDGSGVRYDADMNEVATYPEYTFDWDCTTMGNQICGQAPADAPEKLADLEARDPGNDAYAEGDDDADGYIRADESGWRCEHMGNRVCDEG